MNYDLAGRISNKLFAVISTMKRIVKRVTPQGVLLSFLKAQSTKINLYFERMYVNEWRDARTKHLSNLHLGKNKGVNLVGYLRTAKGIGEAARSSALALASVKIPYSAIDFEYGVPKSQQVESFIKHNDGFRFNVNLLHINPPQMPYLWNVYKGANLTPCFNIGVWYWELPEFPDDWLFAFDLVDEIWAASQFVVDSISEKSPIPVLKIPPCVSPLYNQNLSRLDFGLPLDSFLYMCAYDVLSVQGRKNPFGAIDAFLHAYPENTSSVGLVIKVNNAKENPGEVQSLKNHIMERSNCYIITDVYEKITFNSLVNLVDVYISLHRSEGFGLVPAEAMFFGKPVVMTSWSGNLEYMSDNNSCGVGYNLIPVAGNAGPYTSNQYWADPNINEAATYLQNLYYDRKYYNTIAKEAYSTIRERFSPKRIGDLMYSRLRELKLI